MKSRMNKKSIAIIGSILLILIISIFYIKKPWMSYQQNGPLKINNEIYIGLIGRVGKVGSGKMFGGFNFQNKTDKSLTILSIKPTNIPKNIKFKVYGVATRSLIGTLKPQEYKKKEELYVIKKLPVRIPAHSTPRYQPVIELIPKHAGRYTIYGLLVTYKWKGDLYKDYFRDQFTIDCDVPKNNNNPAPPPKNWP